MDIRDPKPLKTRYLILYNFINAVLWFAILGRVVLLIPLVGVKTVYGGVGNFAKWTQTLAALEVLHVVFGDFSCSSAI
jgi:very-long-chain (3R)-3-hydroxyacyl-CoA dehydratase